MNILLISPTKLDENQEPIKYKKAFLPPLALAILNRLTPSRHKVTIVDDIVDDIDFSQPYDLVGISTMTPQAIRSYQIADRFRNQGVKVVLGGIHATLLPEEAKQHADSVVIGEAENLWEQILDDFENNTYKDFYQEPCLPDLAKKVIPKWDNFRLDIYLKKIGHRLPPMPLFTTRGCPFNCKFCCVTKAYGNTYRVKPIPHVLEEIQAMKTEYYIFADDNMVGNPDYSKELFKMLARQNGKIRWFGQASTTILRHADLIDLAAQAGCDSLFIGIESVDRDNLQSVRKSFNRVEMYAELFARLRKAGIIPYAGVIFGLDHDTPELFRKTLDFLIQNKVGEAFLFILAPVPGTDAFDELAKEGRILHTDWSRYDAVHVVYQPKNMTVEELSAHYWSTYRELYSMKNILRRVFQRVAVSREPFSEFVNNLFYQLYFRQSMKSCELPVTGGFIRLRSTR